MKRYVDGLSTVEDDGSEVLVEEGLDADDLLAGIEEGKQSSVHSYQNITLSASSEMAPSLSDFELTLVGSRSNDNLFGSQFSVLLYEILKLRRVVLADSLEKARSTSRMTE